MLDFSLKFKILVRWVSAHIAHKLIYEWLCCDNESHKS